jgi:hypothetical protein
MELNELLAKGEIAYSLLRKCVALGLIGRPKLEHLRSGKCISNYPDDSLDKLRKIKSLKSRGVTLTEMVDGDMLENDGIRITILEHQEPEGGVEVSIGNRSIDFPEGSKLSVCQLLSLVTGRMGMNIRPVSGSVLNDDEVVVEVEVEW